MNKTNLKLPEKKVEPKIYALTVKSPRLEIIHVGIHFSLDEAYDAACEKVWSYNPGVRDSVDIDMWTVVSAQEFLPQISNTMQTAISQEAPCPRTVEDCLRDFKTAKNGLLNKLIETGDASRVKRIQSTFLTSHEKQLVLEKIARRHVPNQIGAVSTTKID